MTPPSPPFGADWSASFRRGSQDELRRWLDFALECADAADGLALRGFERRVPATRKADGSFVTDVDRAIEDTIRTRIADRYPAHGIHGEERGLESGDADLRWYLDPIDGTHNFMRGIPLFGFLLALERDGELQIGVMSAPAIGRRWFAARGSGAWVVNRLDESGPMRLGVSTISALSDAQILFRSVSDMHRSRVSAGFDALLPDVWRERGYGDFWGYALVAGGAAEAMMEQNLGPWDLAAPWVIVEEAGGRVTDFDGRRTITSGEALATNGLVHELLLGRLHGEPPR